MSLHFVILLDCELIFNGLLCVRIICGQVWACVLHGSFEFVMPGFLGAPSLVPVFLPVSWLENFWAAEKPCELEFQMVGLCDLKLWISKGGNFFHISVTVKIDKMS